MSAPDRPSCTPPPDPAPAGARRRRRHPAPVSAMGSGATWPTRFPGPIRPTARATSSRTWPCLAMARGQQWHWSIREQAAPEALIGVISLMDDEPDNHRGFWLAPAWQGRGYMSEACEAVTGYWFETLGKPRCCARPKPRLTPPRAASPRNPACGCCAPRNAAMSAAIRASCGKSAARAAGAPQPLTPGAGLANGRPAGGSGDCAPSHASLIYSRSPCSRRQRQAAAYRPFRPVFPPIEGGPPWLECPSIQRCVRAAPSLRPDP